MSDGLRTFGNKVVTPGAMLLMIFGFVALWQPWNGFCLPSAWR